MPSNPFVVLNAASARFECTFGRGCEGVCCRNGRPPVYPGEVQRIGSLFPAALHLLRPEARKVVERHGFLSRRRKCGQPMLRVAAGWCVFFHHGCVLHRIGESRGNRFAYKPCVCAFFPLDRRKDGQWYIRQKGYQGEIWDLACLTPGPDTPLAVNTLQEEIALASHLD
jgi:hypothetical protein